MLEGLDDVEWDTLEHAYGEATDVPEQIRNLASNDPKIREQALYDLNGNILHQGTRYEASAYAVPFIFEILKEPGAGDKAELIEFLVNLALGYPDSFLPNGPNVQGWVDEHKYWVERSEKERLTFDDEEWMINLGDFIEVYRAVQKLVSNFYSFIESENDDERLWATFAVAWFREEAKSSIPKVRKVLAEEKSEKNIANAILSLSLLDSYLNDVSDVELFKKYLVKDNPTLIKISAAIALINVLKENIETNMLKNLGDTLIELAKKDSPPGDANKLTASIEKSDGETINLGVYTSGGKGAASEFPWNDGDMVGYISKVLKGFGRKDPEKILPPLCEALQYLDGIPALTLTRTMLWIVFPEPPKGELWTTEELNENQKLVIKAIANSPRAWTYGGQPFGNYRLEISGWRLPTKFEELKRLAGSEEK
ncbi:MAG: hypothetical protein ACFFCM_01755 [Promethearchaeota archaeon]